MPTLKERLAEQVPQAREERSKLIKEYGDRVISEVTVRQMFGGLRGVKALICDTAEVDPDSGLSIRG